MATKTQKQIKMERLERLKKEPMTPTLAKTIARLEQELLLMDRQESRDKMKGDELTYHFHIK